MSSPNIRVPTRAELFAVFKDERTARMVEEILRALNETIPADTTALETALTGHIADAVDAHQASAIGNAPAGTISATTVQAALNELDAEKATVAALNAHITDTADAHMASAVGNVPAGGIAGTTVQAALNELDAEKQPGDALLSALAALVTAADRLIYTTGVDTVALATLTAFARTLLDDADAATARGTLGLAAIAASGTVGDLGGLGANVGTFLATPTSANLRNALSDETGSGAAVFGTSPTISAPVLTGTTYSEQGAPTTKAGAATLTIAELLTGIIEYTGGAAALTLPTGANIDAGILAGLAADRAFEFCVINTGSGTATVSTAAGLSLVGAMTVAAGVSALFCARKTAASTFTVYRLA